MTMKEARDIAHDKFELFHTGFVNNNLSIKSIRGSHIILNNNHFTNRRLVKLRRTYTTLTIVIHS